MSARGHCVLETTSPTNRAALLGLPGINAYTGHDDDDGYSIEMNDVNSLRWHEFVPAAPTIAWIATLDSDCEESATIWVYHPDMDGRPVALAALSDGDPGLSYATLVAHADNLAPILGEGSPWWWFTKVSDEIIAGQQAQETQT